MAFTVVICGRPNVGKSTLFNRLVGRRSAIVDSTPGVTRDWREGAAKLGPLRFRVIDTAGLEEADPGSLEARMTEQTAAALEQGDLALLLVDGRVGLTPVDRHFADWLRRHDCPVLVAVNKCESAEAQAGAHEAHALGLGDLVAISARHGEGMGDLYDALAARMPEADQVADTPLEGEEGEQDDIESGPLRLAVIGRPNVGKSTLINRLVGEERVLTGPEAGITRDAVVLEWDWRGRAVRLIDTAGVRRRAKVTAALEKMSVASTLDAVRFAHVVVLLLDAEAPLERQDLTLAAMIADEGRAPVVAVNKWDRITAPADLLKALHARLLDVFPQARGLPVVPLCALTGQGVSKLMPAVFGADENWNRRVPTAALNRWLEEVIAHHPPPLVAGRRLKLRYMTQVNIRPPSFALFASRPGKLPEAYRRYLVNGLREAFGLEGVPLRLMLRKGKNPYAKD